LAGSWFQELWSKEVNSPYYPDRDKDIGSTPLPAINGGAPGVSSMVGGWTLAIGSATKHPDLAWELIDIAQNQKNLLKFALVTAVVPPIPEYQSAPEYLNISPTSNAMFAKIANVAQYAPLDANYSVWGQGFLTATQAVVVNPDTSVDDAVNQLRDYVSNQVGPDAITTLP
jgi:multiple sugar transport system substrate-binding protein